ncbi:MAG: hypothetical protein JNL90_17415 [Planctomycetes bacterium]|nr:hypothetical protein [Planctomycetota bacterium]
MSRARRLLIYSPDSFGLGHFRRCLSIARELSIADPALSVLCLTGSPKPSLFAYPRGFDTVKLPSLTKDADGAYQSLSGNLELARLAALRTSIVDATLRDFEPDLLLVDHAPLGTLGELLPVLERLRGDPSVTTVLGLRDVIDSPERTAAEWAERDLARRVPELFDRVLVYGDPRVWNTIERYGLGAALGERATHTGIVCRCMPKPARPSGFDGPARRGRVLITTGGGADGLPIVEDALHALAGWNGPVRAILGPLADPQVGERLRALARALPDCTLIGSSRAMCREVRDADAVIAMAGYNTAYETLRAGRLFFAVPRHGPRLEQRVRAARLAELGLAVAVDSDPASRRASLAHALSTTRSADLPPAALRPDFRGARRAAAHLHEWLLASPRAAAPLSQAAGGAP